MIKYILPQDSRLLIKVDTENVENISTVDYTDSRINWLWVVDEDGELEGKPIKKGNVVISFYSTSYYDAKDKIIILDNPELTEFYKEMKEAKQDYLDKINSKQQACDGNSEVGPF